MKLNNKGMTLIELLISLLFIGIILVFMFSMLNGLRKETDNNNFAYNNQVNKIDAIHTIQKDLNTYVLKGIEDKSVNSIELHFHYLKGNDNKTAKLSFSSKNNKNYLNYENVDGETFSWEMKGADIDSCGKFTIYNEGASSYQYDENNLTESYVSNNYYFKIHINIYNSNYHEQNNKDKNNIIDDLEISYSDYNFNLDNNGAYLTSQNSGTYNIGKC